MRFAGSKIQSFMDGGMDSQMLADYGLRTRSQEREAATNADAITAMGGMRGLQAIGEANYAAETTAAQGAAASQMALADGISTATNAIAGGFTNMPSTSSVPKKPASGYHLDLSGRMPHSFGT